MQNVFCKEMLASAWQIPGMFCILSGMQVLRYCTRLTNVSSHKIHFEVYYTRDYVYIKKS